MDRLTAPSSGQVPRAPTTPGFTVLIVDDNARIRSMIRAILGDRAMIVHECADGLDALAMYRQVRPDWVLMDVSMPRLDGISATRQLLALDPDSCVVMVTDYADPSLERAALAAGAKGYVVKENLMHVLDIILPKEGK